MTTSAGTLLVLAAVVGLGACVQTARILEASDGGGTCVHTCTSDPGSGPVNCNPEEAGLEFFPHSIVDFEGPPAGPFIGRYMYGYFDGTSFAHAEGAAPSVALGYQPPATPLIRCADDTKPNHVLHITGGPFLGWGGGIGVAMEHLSQDEGLCVVPPLAEYCPPASAGAAVAYAALDLSHWDGVSVWARRGPDSQPLLRMLVGNKDTDDDISYLTYQADPKLPRSCERVRECSCPYKNFACAPVDAPVPGAVTGGFYCGEPGAAPGPAIMAPTSSVTGATNTCNVTRCNDAYAAYPDRGPDLAFSGRPCTPHAFRNGVQSSYCFDPGVDPPPAEPDKQCGDHWTAPLHLTTDWQLFKVPFTTMFQQGFAKRSPTFDLKSVSMVRLTWEAGYVDYWIDDLRFYRLRR